MLENVPSAPKARYWSIATRNRVPKVIFWLLVTMIPFAFLITLMLFGPNLNETPNVVAGKLSTINNIATILLFFNIWVLVVKSRRMPIPRSKYI